MNFSNNSERESARVTHANVYLERERRARIDRVRAEDAHRQTLEAQRERQSRERVRPTASSLALAKSLTREERARRVAELKRSEEKARRDAIDRARNPEPRDPRTSAEKLAQGAGQSRLRSN